jgi:hypothetical protein
MRFTVLVLGIAGALASSAAASAAIRMPTFTHELALKKAAVAAGVTFPPPPCPENGIANGVLGQAGAGGLLPVGNCGVSQPVATTLPWPGNMSYYGGHVQTHPREYLVLWGWGDPGAFPDRSCQPETFTEPLADGTSTSQTVGCDPDGAAKYMADFLAQIGGTQWAGVSTQYYQTEAGGTQTPIGNDPNVLAGIWVDDGNNPDLSQTNFNNAAGPTNTNTDLAAEASRAAAHFGVSGGQALWNANFIIAQPAGFSDPNAQALGYCAFHDYTESDASGNSYYKDPSVKQGILGQSQGISYTNMPYVLNQGSNCGEDAVNSKADGGLIDGFSIVLGHEVEETITDPGAGATVGNVTNASSSTAATGGATYFGGWYDATEPNENGDKCAWVGNTTNSTTPEKFPGSPGDIGGNAGGRFAVQSLWSNDAAQGTGYCSGVASTDLPSQVGNGEENSGTAYPVPPPTTSYNLNPCSPTFVEDTAVDDNFSFEGRTLAGPGSNPQLDVVSGRLAQTADGRTLRAIVTLRNLSTSIPAPGGENDYRVLWNYGGTSYFVLATVEPGGSVLYFDGHAINAGLTTRYQPLNVDSGSFTPGANGTVEIDVPLANVGNPPTGAVLAGPTAEADVRFPGTATTGLLQTVDLDGPNLDYQIGQSCTS